MDEKNCLNCEHFAWWDGDYCCLSKFRILCRSPKGEFTDEILTSMKANKDCEDYDEAFNKTIVELHKEAFDEFMKKKEK